MVRFLSLASEMAGHVTRMGKRRRAYRVVVGKTEETGHLKREDNIIKDLKKWNEGYGLD